MSEITLEAIEKLLDGKLEPINTKLAAIEETVSNHTTMLTALATDVKNHTTILSEHSTVLANHTTMLDGIAKDVKTLLDQKTVSAHRFDRLEHWAQRVGDKIGIKLEL